MKQNANRWTCPACGFETSSEEEKDNHIQSMEGDPAHMNVEDSTVGNEEITSQQTSAYINISLWNRT